MGFTSTELVPSRTSREQSVLDEMAHVNGH